MFMVFALIFYLTFLASGEVTSSTAVSSEGSSALLPQGPPQDSCRELRPGESLRVDQPLRTQSPTGVARTYRITRDSRDPQLFVAEFNIRFGPLDEALRERFGNQIEGIDTTEKNALAPYSDEMRAAFIARTRQCFESMRDRLRSSNGQRLELRLDYPTLQDPDAPPDSTVRIQSSEGRSNSASWARSIDCNAIVHEVMHLMGLCDGYEETSRTVNLPHPEGGMTPEYSCRSIEPANSIMHNQEAAGIGVSYEVARCTQSADTARHVVSTRANPLPTICPDGRPIKILNMGQRTYQQSVASEVALLGRSTGKYGQSREPVFFFYRELPPPASTLYPAQMRMITQPFCNSANQRYINCAQNVYRTRETEGCAVVPDYCRTTDFLQ